MVSIFADLFVALALVYGDSEQNIRNGAEQIDRALKVRSSIFYFMLSSLARYCVSLGYRIKQHRAKLGRTGSRA